MGERSYLSIGDVLALLREEFPDITISKIRFLESRGLLVPERTPSGYRKFYDHDVDRLRWILRQQREHFLPLKVIKGRLEGAESAQQPESLFDPAEPPPAEHLAGVASLPSQNGSAHPSGGRRRLEEENGRVAIMQRHGDDPVLAPVRPLAAKGEEPEPALTPPAPAPEAPPETTAAPTRPEAAPARVAKASGNGRRTATSAAGLIGSSLTAAELAQASGMSVAEIEQLESFGLIEGKTIAGVHCFDEEALEVAKLAASFATFGVEARHLRLFKHAAERQAGLYSQVVMPLLRQRNPQAREKAEADLARMAELGTAMQASFVRASFEDLTGR